MCSGKTISQNEIFKYYIVILDLTLLEISNDPEKYTHITCENYERYLS